MKCIKKNMDFWISDENGLYPQLHLQKLKISEIAGTNAFQVIFIKVLGRF